jgi:hypothetical protein
MKTIVVRRLAAVAVLLWICLLDTSLAQAGGRFGRRQRVVATEYRPADVAPSPMLGTFYPTPYVTVRGNMPAGGGYSPLGQFGDVSLSSYGPMSAFRQVSAPLVVYQRGYNGALYPVVGRSFSNPNLPAVNPVVYPTQANLYYGPKFQTTPPWWDSATMWIDHN